ncbi:glycerophosphodiester phosphodiesterase [Arthrobacter cryoconiti]|uniref:Glycerophosphodiester phosphodiesterase n=1 Tax=Arthrobacter cryoconiti TaxID=748907 RepID=A0ABV8QX71_9MICC|nr:glycerophosphodiester phosphodiesterase family protein [Arthrobacter cryoconiti]MCC9067466.1 glycerophosphodiester phosphodiesterase [Arthrobacter cryoconiti]
MPVKIYAHRGSSARFAEHTRAAYVQALADGADGVECDLQLSADGVLVLVHDEEVDRTSNGTGKVAGLTLAQLKSLDFSSWKGAQIPAESGGVGEQFLTLSELIDILASATRPIGLAIELKYGAVFDPALVDATLAALASRGWSAQTSTLENVRVSFMSFHPEAVAYLAQQIPAERLCQLLEDERVSTQPASGGPAEHELLALLRMAREVAEKLLDDGLAHIVGPSVEYVRANQKNIARWRAAGHTFRVWTVDSGADLELCLATGMEEVTTNRPADIKALLADA